MPTESWIEQPRVSNYKTTKSTLPQCLSHPVFLSNQLNLFANRNSSHVTQVDSLKRNNPAQIIISGSLNANNTQLFDNEIKNKSQLWFRVWLQTLIEKRKSQISSRCVLLLAHLNLSFFACLMVVPTIMLFFRDFFWRSGLFEYWIQ